MAFHEAVDYLRMMKQFKCLWHLPKSQLPILLEQLSWQTSGETQMCTIPCFQATLAAAQYQEQKLQAMAMAAQQFPAMILSSDHYK